MTCARQHQVDLDVTPYYHCVTRCVRRAFLCGDDHYSGRNFDHRKKWVVERIRLLGEVFAVDICAYAVMSNHLHLVLRVDRERARRWTDDDIAARVGRIFTSAFSCDTPARLRSETVELWRERLTNISWMMRCLNEWIARRANKEDDCKGRFWEGRFHSQALLDDGALLTCMSYVDLNPVRAKMAQSLEASDFTSIKERLRAVAKAKREGRDQPTTPVALAPMVGERKRENQRERLPISLVDYVELLEWTGRAIREDGRGVLTGPPPGLLTATRLNPRKWVESIRHWGERTWLVAGARPTIERVAKAREQRWCKGHRWLGEMYCAA